VHHVLGDRPAAAQERRTEDPAVRAVLDKPIKAVGGEENLRALRAVTWKAKGTVIFGERKIPVAFDGAAQGTGQVCFDFNAIFEQAVTFTLIFDRDNTWKKGNGNTKSREKTGRSDEADTRRRPAA
jgi:hypothetical protein